MVFQWFGVNAFVALYYDVVEFKSNALTHIRAHMVMDNQIFNQRLVLERSRSLVLLHMMDVSLSYRPK